MSAPAAAQEGVQGAQALLGPRAWPQGGSGQEGPFPGLDSPKTRGRYPGAAAEGYFCPYPSLERPAMRSLLFALLLAVPALAQVPPADTLARDTVASTPKALAPVLPAAAPAPVLSSPLGSGQHKEAGDYLKVAGRNMLVGLLFAGAGLGVGMVTGYGGLNDPWDYFPFAFYAVGFGFQISVPVNLIFAGQALEK
jgi:hypothetical protein